MFTSFTGEMLGFFLSVIQILSLVTGNPLSSERHLIDSRPLIFLKESENDSQVVNSTLILKKKENSGGPVFYSDSKPKDNVNNHHIDAEGVVWKRPYRPASEGYSNHKGPLNWNRRKAATTTTTSKKQPIHATTTMTTYTTTSKKQPIYATMKPLKRLPVKDVIINNHNPSSPVRSRPLRPSSIVTIVDPPVIPPTELIGDRVKSPDTIKSATIKVLDAPSHVKTQIKHNKIIVIQKRFDQLPITTTFDKQGSISSTTLPTPVIQATRMPAMGNFSVAPVMDIWSNIPIPSTPAWATGQSKPVKGGNARPTTALQSQVVPHIPFVGFMTQLLTPLLSRPLTSSAVNSGMQGIKAMQGFLRNSLLGAMFCFLPSAFIALSLTATQRAQLRKIPEIDDMMVFCKKCLENLKEIRELTRDDHSWLNEAS